MLTSFKRSQHLKKVLDKSGIKCYNKIIKRKEGFKIMTKKEMLQLVVMKFGVEHENSIYFAESIEWLGRVESEALMDEMLTWPVFLEEDED